MAAARFLYALELRERARAQGAWPARHHQREVRRMNKGLQKCLREGVKNTPSDRGLLRAIRKAA
ncbi:MAG: hypothetical protein C5B58_08270 [Acidobacteria bacterium]|nr:MAG: hypothetical protein C5B58_08270 [Acidobacteriota bacterium]